jgi:hypothetical protein
VTTPAELAEMIRDDIAVALQEPDQSMRMTMLRAAADTVFRIAYDEVPGDPKGIEQAAIEFLNQINGAMGQTEPDGTEAQVDRISDIWGIAAHNAARYYSAPKASKTWITMLDDRVRDHHIPMHGVTVAAGQTFNVGGFNLHYPGEPVGPPDIWINCRCHLDLGLTADGAEMPNPMHTHDITAHTHSISHDHSGIAYNTTSDPLIATSEVEPSLVARSFDTEQRRKLADKGHALPDGSFPIENVEDLRNAIAAFGRAKDKDAAKRHIKKRARALGHPELIPDSWTASGEEADEEVLTAWAPSTSPPGTHDGPGWLTNPKDTQRLRNYWERGPGAAKIRWGTPGDLTRCHKHMAKYVGPYAWGTCQNMHKEALGYWNPESRGRHRRLADGMAELVAAGIADETTPEMQALIDAAFAVPLEDSHMLNPPTEWFANPGLTAATPLTIARDGRVVGHLATWDTCHVGISGECVTPPKSKTDYAYFRTGEVETNDGSRVPVGQITMETGHAEREASAQAAVSHYDDTGTGVADVAAGEDDIGIWVAGAMRPGVSEQQMYVLQATGSISGDWRRIGGNLELVAALAVNVPGFPIPRTEMAASAGVELSLVAAGIVTIDAGVDADRVAIAVLAALDEREAEKVRRSRADALVAQISGMRAEALAAAIS